MSNPQQWLKLVFIIKLSLVGGLILFGWLGFRLGDKPLVAADETEAPIEAREAEETVKAESIPEDDDDENLVPASSSNPELAKNAAAAENDDPEIRRSYLDDLLYIPKSTTDEMKLEEQTRLKVMLDRKRQQVDGRIDLLKKREALLKDLENSIDKKLKKLDEEMAFFQQTQQKEKQIQKERLDQLVEFYKKMEPKKAAPVFEKLDKDLVVALWKEFPLKQTQAIISLMNPEKAVELSEYFGRLRSAKEYDLLKEINLALRNEFEECRGLPAEAGAN